MKTIVCAFGLLIVATNQGKVLLFPHHPHGTHGHGGVDAKGMIVLEATDAANSGSNSNSSANGSGGNIPSIVGSIPLCVTAGLNTNNQHVHVYATFENKVVCCWDVQTRALLGSCVARKKITAMVSSTVVHSTLGRKLVLLASDKAGDIWAFDGDSLGTRVNSAGHTASVIADMLQMPSGAIVSCDRDEKIRISHFPHLESVEGYCLGHTSVVTSVANIAVDGDQQLLLSCGWDRKLFLWDVSRCAAISEAECLTAEDKRKQEQQLLLQEGQQLINDETVQMNITEKMTVEVEEAGADGDDEDDTMEKIYDETASGSFPIRIVSNPGLTTFGILFRNSTELHLHRVFSSHGSTSSSSSVTISPPTVVQLPRIPVDAVFSDRSNDDGSITLLVLFDSDVELKAYHITAQDVIPVVSEEPADSVWAQINQQFTSYCKEHGKLAESNRISEAVYGNVLCRCQLSGCQLVLCRRRRRSG
jgi:WD40 repeat protein